MDHLISAASMFFVTANNDRILLSDKMAVACVRHCGLSRFVSFSDFMDKQMWACRLGTQSRFHEKALIHQVTWSSCRLQSLSFDSEITLLTEWSSFVLLSFSCHLWQNSLHHLELTGLFEMVFGNREGRPQHISYHTVIHCCLLVWLFLYWNVSSTRMNQSLTTVHERWTESQYQNSNYNLYLIQLTSRDFM